MTDTETEEVVSRVQEAVEEAVSDVEMEDHDAYISGKHFAGTAYVTVNINREE